MIIETARLRLRCWKRGHLSCVDLRRSGGQRSSNYDPALDLNRNLHSKASIRTYTIAAGPAKPSACG